MMQRSKSEEGKCEAREKKKKWVEMRFTCADGKKMEDEEGRRRRKKKKT